jgi:cytochrome c5
VLRFLVLFLLAGPAMAETGGEIYRANCASCHDAGANGAPRLGVAGDWLKRVEKGRPALIRNGIQMKPHIVGAPPADVTAAVDFMLSTMDILVNSYSRPPRLESGK